MNTQRTSVGLDVHARSVVACRDRRADRGGAATTIRVRPGRGRRLGEVVTAAGGGDVRGRSDGVRVGAVVRGVGDRVSWSRRRRSCSGRPGTGSRPTRGTRCIWPGCCGWTRSSRSGCRSLEQETARDLVRAREDNRGELMAARHRLSKLLLRHGIIYDGKQAWTGAHDAWLRRHRFEHPGLQAAFDADYEAVQQVGARKDRLDRLIEQMAADQRVRGRGATAGVSAGRLHVDRVRVGGRDRRLGQVHRIDASARSSGSSRRSTPPGSLGCRDRSRRPATRTPAGCSSKQPGITANRTDPAR